MSISPSNIIPKTYTGRQAIHKYWSKKPAEILGQYIECYSQPFDLILDPFCGSGVSISEAVRLNRRAIGIDINPIAIRQTEAGVSHVDLARLIDAFNTIKASVEPNIRYLYQMTCPHCKKENAYATHTIWHLEKAQQSRLYCTDCQRKSRVDYPVWPDIDPSLINTIHLPHHIMANSKLNVLKDKEILSFFTKRNAYSLNCLLNAINDIEDQSVRETMQLCFTGALSQASKLVFVIKNRQGKKHHAQVGSWTSGFWLPAEYFEIYPIQCFENRFKRMLAGKKDILSNLPSVSAHHGVDSLLKDKLGYLALCTSATDLAFIPSESVDYILTDPPHGNRIPYLELSQLWNGWLNLIPDWENEIVVSNAKSRNKNLSTYETGLISAFTEMSRVLKTEKHLSIMFNARDFPTWAILLTALDKASLYLKTADKMPYSSGSLAQDTRKNALTYDLMITAQKCLTPIEHQASETDITGWIQSALQNTPLATHELLRQCLLLASEKKQLIKAADFINALHSSSTYKKQCWQAQT